MPDAWLRPAILAGIAALLLLAELIVAARPHRRERWVTNLGLGVVGAVIGGALTAVFPLGAALWASDAEVGLLRWLGPPPWLALPIVVVVLDLAIYWQHRAMHAVPSLWRLHRLHHRDLGMDLTTGVRFHPGEILLSGLYKAALVVLLGASPLAVIVFEIWLAAGSLWEHANLRMPAALDRRLRHVLVTPAMHLVHHGDARIDIDSNFGFSTSLWDRLFGSYREQAASERVGCE